MLDPTAGLADFRFSKIPSGVGLSFKFSNGRVAIRGAARQAKAEKTSPSRVWRWGGGFLAGKGSARRGALAVGRGFLAREGVV